MPSYNVTIENVNELAKNIGTEVGKAVDSVDISNIEDLASAIGSSVGYSMTPIVTELQGLIVSNNDTNTTLTTFSDTLATNISNLVSSIDEFKQEQKSAIKSAVSENNKNRTDSFKTLSDALNDNTTKLTNEIKSQTNQLKTNSENEVNALSDFKETLVGQIESSFADEILGNAENTEVIKEQLESIAFNIKDAMPGRYFNRDCFVADVAMRLFVNNLPLIVGAYSPHDVSEKAIISSEIFCSKFLSRHGDIFIEN